MPATISNKLEFLYDKYAAIVFGMIHCCVQDNAIAEEILKEVYLQLKKQMEQNDEPVSFIKLLVLTRRVTALFFSQNKFEEHHYLKHLPDIKNDDVLQLICFGRYTTKELSELLNLDECIIKDKLCAAIRACKQKNNTTDNTLLMVV